MSPGRDTLAALLRRPRYEVFPVEGIADEVVTHLPTEIEVAVTSSPTRGIEATLRLCEELTSARFQVAPHLAARLIRDEEHLREIFQRLFAIGVRDVFAIAGDADLPAGKFDGATALLAAMAELGQGLEQVGISGYPSTSGFPGRLRARSSFASRRGSESVSRRDSRAGMAGCSRACSCTAAT